MIQLCFLDELKKSKNLLAFSGGADSVAMFFCLLEAGVAFDVAIVDYGIRRGSEEETKYAKDLCSMHNKQCFCLLAPKIDSNFEHQARQIRYDFFEEIISTHQYENLILAHHLGDKLEWFLMQLSKGAGLNTILGFEGVTYVKNYKITRPFINTTKSEIYAYCKKHKFYEDSSNTECKYKRNEFRHLYANNLIEKYAKGIIKSFEYLSEEKKLLYQDAEILHLGGIAYFPKSSLHQDIYEIDKIIKKMGYVISSLQRKEILKTDFSCEIGGRYIIENNQNYIFVSKIHTYHLSLPKKFKDIARRNAIPKKIRKEIYQYMQGKNMSFEAMNEYLEGKFTPASRHCQ